MRFALVILAAASSSSLAAAKKVKVDAGGFNAEMHEHAEELTNSFEQITDNFKLDKEVLRHHRRRCRHRHRRRCRHRHMSPKHAPFAGLRRA